VEDLLPFFPDFTLIDEFKDAVLDELGRYSTRIDECRAAMEAGTMMLATSCLGCLPHHA